MTGLSMNLQVLDRTWLCPALRYYPTYSWKDEKNLDKFLSGCVICGTEFNLHLWHAKH